MNQRPQELQLVITRWDRRVWGARSPELLPAYTGLRYTTSTDVTAGAAAVPLAGSQSGSKAEVGTLAAPTSSRYEWILLAPAVAESAQCEDD